MGERRRRDRLVSDEEPLKESPVADVPVASSRELAAEVKGLQAFKDVPLLDDRPVGGGVKVYWKDEKHDDKVIHAIGVAQSMIEERGILGGVGVIDFADCTIVVVSRALQTREVRVVERREENSILHGGFNTIEMPEVDLGRGVR